eukprot:tig00000553_g2112.t1
MQQPEEAAAPSAGKQIQVDSANVRVHVRLRPQPPEAMGGMITVSPDDVITIKDPIRGGEREFAFDGFLKGEATQQDVYDRMCRPLIDHVLQGFNACCIAYGQTGSGKTYSMFGEMPDRLGIAPRAVQHIFEQIGKQSPYSHFGVFVSFLENYLDQIRDLGRAYLDQNAGKRAAVRRPGSALRRRPSSGGATSPRRSSGAGSGGGGGGASGDLEIHETPKGEVYVKDLSMIPVSSVDEVMEVIAAGLARRATHETAMNQTSSRSHTVLAITVLQSPRSGAADMEAETVTGVLNLVDLAGSERIAKSQSEGQRLKEAVMINQSLTALGKVVVSLDKGEDGAGGPARHVGYRDSKLTRILQNSIGGNSYTTLLACLNPTVANYEECLNTLQFANRCQNVTNRPRVNYVDARAAGQEKRIARLTDEIAQLRQLVADLRRELQRKEDHIASLIARAGQVQPSASASALGSSASGASVAQPQQQPQPQQQQYGRSRGPCGSPRRPGAYSAAGLGTAAAASASGSSGAAYKWQPPGGSSVASAAPGAQQAQQQQAGSHRPGSSGPTGRAHSLPHGGAGAGDESRLLAQLEATEGYLRSARQENAELRQRVEKKKAELAASQQKNAADSDRFATTERRLNDKVRELTQEVDEMRARAALEARERAAQHSASVAELTANNQRLVSDLTEQMRRMPEEFRVTSIQNRETAQLEANARDRLERDYAERLAAVKQAKDTEISALKLSLENMVEGRTGELRRTSSELAELKASSKEEISSLRGQVEYLYKYARHCQKLLFLLDGGQYPMEQSPMGPRPRIPKRDRPGPIDYEKCPYASEIRKFLLVEEQRERNNLLVAQSRPVSRPFSAAVAATAPLGPTGDKFSGRAGGRPSTAASGSSGGPLRSLSAGFSRPGTAPVGPGAGLESAGPRPDTAPAAPGSPGGPEAGLESQFQKLRQGVLDDLASNPTVDYIRGLEEEKRRYAETVRRMNAEAQATRIAIEAKDRLIEKLQAEAKGAGGSRPTSASSDYAQAQKAFASSAPRPGSGNLFSRHPSLLRQATGAATGAAAAPGAGPSHNPSTASIPTYAS